MTEMYRTRVNKEGRMVIPAECRARLGISPGQEVLLTVTPHGLEVTTLERALKQFQAEVQGLVGPASLVDELLAERRAEVVRERHD